jgi:hypothetical protein
VPSGKKLKFSFRAKFASEKLNYVPNTFFMSAASCAAAEQHAGLNIFSPPPWKQSTKETFSPLPVEKCAKVSAENDDSNKYKVAGARGRKASFFLVVDIERWYNSTFIAANSLK